MATFNDFEKIYKETRGTAFTIGYSKRKSKWYANEVNKKLYFEAENSFALFDELIKYMKSTRKENSQKYSI